MQNLFSKCWDSPECFTCSASVFQFDCDCAAVNCLVSTSFVQNVTFYWQ
jgi:hypothetical protein